MFYLCLFFQNRHIYTSTAPWGDKDCKKEFIKVKNQYRAKNCANSENLAIQQDMESSPDSIPSRNTSIKKMTVIKLKNSKSL